MLDSGGIITDRDITVRAVAKGADTHSERISDYMSADPVTGKPDWDLEKVAETMAKHQVRRLPIVENDQVVGIVSLGDVARHDEHKSTVAGSLKDISQPAGMSNGSNHGLRQVATGMVLATATGAAVSFLFVSKRGKQLRQQVRDEIDDMAINDNAMKMVEDLRDKIEEVADNIADMKPKRKVRRGLRFFN
ncbi:MAG: CBS domain-containing protein [Chloroflexi bacterium]|nr:CBS domain-containing protein [Chloroflexota bacterium]